MKTTEPRPPPLLAFQNPGRRLPSEKRGESSKQERRRVEHRLSVPSVQSSACSVPGTLGAPGGTSDLRV